MKYDLLIEETKIVFGKTFFYSTIVIAIIIVLYLSIILSAKSQFLSLGSLIVPYILVYLLIATHPAYDWLSTFVRDLVYNVSSGFSLVNDPEVYQVLKNYKNPRLLENVPLLRLNLINQEMRKDKAKTPVDGLRNILEESIEYFRPEEDERTRRTKANLKYHLLKMIAFDQAEEGQILWELGFEEYPLRILSQESRSRPPLFKSISASDYNYISRNAFIALKKEAIHDIAWRISYLEKQAKKKMF